MLLVVLILLVILHLRLGRRLRMLLRLGRPCRWHRSILLPPRGLRVLHWSARHGVTYRLHGRGMIVVFGRLRGTIRFRRAIHRRRVRLRRPVRF